MNLPVHARDGADTDRTVEFDDDVFGIEPNDHVIWLDVRAAQAAARQGTHKTKERSEVRGSGRKLYRQKGTGHARVGDAQSPIRRGGGTVFGPKPHQYKVGINRKTKKLARRSATAYKLQEDAVRVVEDFSLEVPKTREVADMLSGNEIDGGAVLILTDGHDQTLVRSGRNIPGVTILDAVQASTLDLMRAQVVVMMESAVEPFTEALRPLRRKPILADDEG